MNKLVILIDSGDTLIDESTQTYDANGDVLTAELIPGARKALEHFKRAGHIVALVADGTRISFERVHRLCGIYALLDARVYSQDLNTRKPDVMMFERAYELLGLSESDKPRTVMVGNNLERDIVGAHAFGIKGVLIKYSPRYDYAPKCPEQVPDYEVDTEAQLCELIDELSC